MIEFFYGFSLDLGSFKKERKKEAGPPFPALHSCRLVFHYAGKSLGFLHPFGN